MPPVGTDAILDNLALDRAFSAQSQKREIFKGYYDDRVAELKAFFKEHNFEIAGAAFDVLLDLKKNLMRKNGYIPDYGHEIDQLLPLMNLIKTGKISAEDLEEIEKHHGSIEKWFCAIITHDIGEDFGWFKADLIAAIQSKLTPTTNSDTIQYREAMIADTAESMEVLTHDRKFSPDAVRKFLGHDFKIPRLKRGKNVRLHDLECAFKHKFGLSDQGLRKYKVYGRYNDKTQEPEIIVTSYGGQDDNGRHFTDWNLYIQTVLSHNIFVALTKLGDRVTGMATRPYINNDDPYAYATYLNHTYALFDISGAANMMEKKLYPGSPLIKYAVSLSKMMGVTHRCGHLHLCHHGGYEAEGRKGYDSENFDFNKEANGDQTTLFLSEFFPMAMEFYPYNPDHAPSHPLAAMLRDYRSCYNPRFDGTRTGLYFVMESALRENCEHGVHEALFDVHEGVEANDNTLENDEPSDLVRVPA